ncbi:MAG: DNRLRE domain-containing protein, partial [Actinomycetes bacterium]
MQRTPRTRVGLILTVAAGLGASSFAIGGLTSTSSLADGPVDRSVRFVATQDAFGSSLRPNLRRATIDHLVARDTRGVSKVSYLKFTVTRSALGPGGVVGAKLLLTPRASMRVPIQVRLVHRNDWSERFLTYNNAPREGTVVGRVRPGPTTTPRWIDVSQVVTKPGTYSFSLTAARGTARFASAESSRPPTLIVRVKKGGSGSTTPTTTSSPTPTASGTTQAPTESATTTAPVTSSPTAPQTVTADPTTATRGCAQRFPGDPCAGTMYYGASVEGGDPRTLESQIGRTITMFRSYMQPTSSASKFAARAAADVAAGRIPMISTKVPGTWADLAAGKQDPWLIERV